MASSGNFCLLNFLPNSSRFRNNLSKGNLFSNPGQNCTGFGTMALTTGKKWYMEGIAQNAYNTTMGIFEVHDANEIQNNLETTYYSNTSYKSAFYHRDGSKYIDGSNSSYGATFTTNDVVGMAVDLESATNTITFYKNNSSQGSFNLGTNGLDYLFCISRGTSGGGWHMNFGQDSTFGGAKTAGNNTDANGFGDFLYSVPSGHLALTTANLGIDSNIDPAQTSTDFPQKQFNCIQYTGNRVDNSSTNALTGVGFKPDLVWIKCISGTSASSDYRLTDSTRGATILLRGNQDTAEQTESNGVETFDSDGFTVGGDNNYNNASSNYVAWCWKASEGQAQDKTYAVTVVSDGGNKYRLDGHGTSGITIEVNEGSTITFDQSDSSNSGHPLRLSTTSNGTHGGGSEYTTGVTTTGTPGNAGAKTVITVAASAPTLYYYCTQHSGMGGQMNTPALSEGIGNSHTAGSTITKVQKNTKAGFSIMTYTGTGSNATIEHGLTSAPEFIIVKRRSSQQNWALFHSALGPTYNGTLNTTAAWSTGSAWWNNTSPTTSVTTISTEGRVNQNSGTYVMYSWHGVEGYSKFGKYLGNGSTDGAFIYTGFKPRLLWIRRHGGTDSNFVYDSARSVVNPLGNFLQWNDTAAQTGTGLVDFMSNGFKWRATSASQNPSGGEMIYGAWGDVPFKYNNGLSG